MTEAEILDLHDFYTIENSKGKKPNIMLNKLKIIRKLKQMGYVRYDDEDGATNYVNINQNIISLTSDILIKDAFEDYVSKLPTREYKTMERIDGESTEITTHITSEWILDKMYQNMDKLFSNVDRLRPEKKINILQDDPDKKYLFFNNVALYVDSNGINSIDYNDLNGYVWNSSVHEKDFFYTKNKGDFEEFIEDVSGTPERKESLMSMLGYLMHDNYESTLHAILLTDVGEDMAGMASGGTGKGIIGKALSYMLNRQQSDRRYFAIPGKGFDPDKDTRYASADISTQLLHIEDIDDRVDIKALYNDISDGATIRRPFQKIPTIKKIKMMISTNKTIRIDGSSTARRLCIFELANYYGATYTPEDKFGRRFFESKWDSGDWAAFYSFMCRCLQIYFERGVIQSNNQDYYYRSLLEQTNEDFVFYLQDAIYYEDKTERRYSKTHLYNTFIEKYPSFHGVKSKTLTQWVKAYFKYKNIPYTEIRSTVDEFVIYPTQATRATSQEAKQKLRTIN